MTDIVQTSCIPQTRRRAFLKDAFSILKQRDQGILYADIEQQYSAFSTRYPRIFMLICTSRSVDRKQLIEMAKKIQNE